MMVVDDSNDESAIAVFSDVLYIQAVLFFWLLNFNYTALFY